VRAMPNHEIVSDSQTASSLPDRQALLEIYVAVVLNTLYNDLDTH
jgi:hypothetical protein